VFHLEGCTRSNCSRLLFETILWPGSLASAILSSGLCEGVFEEVVNRESRVSSEYSVRNGSRNDIFPRLTCLKNKTPAYTVGGFSKVSVRWRQSRGQFGFVMSSQGAINTESWHRGRWRRIRLVSRASLARRFLTTNVTLQARVFNFNNQPYSNKV